jgi:hypothetical protein
LKKRYVTSEVPLTEEQMTELHSLRMETDMPFEMKLNELAGGGEHKPGDLVVSWQRNRILVTEEREE